MYPAEAIKRVDKHKKVKLSPFKSKGSSVHFCNGSSTQNPYDPKLLPKNYDYEDDDYTFTRWVENNAELELLKTEQYED